jgi:aspartate/methionine/tyrosine aminotransferase
MPVESGVTMSLAPYMEWAKTRPAARFDLAGSNVLACSLDDLEGAAGALDLSGHNDNGYQPLVEAIAGRYGVSPEQVATAQGTSGANFQVCAALLKAGDDVLVERPGYDPLLAAPRLLNARVLRFDRDRAAGYALDPDRVRAAMTPRTKLIIVTNSHNPTGAVADGGSLRAIGELAASAGASVIVDEVYLDVADSGAPAAALLGDVFISTSSLTKAYGLAALRCGWSVSAPAIAERIRRARDVIDGTGSIVTERLSVLAFAQLDRLHRRATALLAANRTLVREFLEGRRELEWFDPQRGTVVFPRLPGVEDTDRFAERLMSELGVAVVPGRFFEAPAHFRLGLGGATESLGGGLAAIGSALDARAW